MDGSPPGSSAHGILQARILEWVSIFSSGVSSRSRDWTQVLALWADSLSSEHQENPFNTQAQSGHKSLSSFQHNQNVWHFHLKRKQIKTFGILKKNIKERNTKKNCRVTVNTFCSKVFYLHWGHEIVCWQPNTLSTWMQSQKWQNDLCSFPRQTIQYHSNTSLCPNC